MKKFKYVMSVLFCVTILCSSASAATINSVPYKGYELNDNNESVPAPVGYSVENIVNDYDLELDKELGTAKGLFFDGTDTESVFSLITTENYVVRLDENYNMISYYDIPDCKNIRSIAMDESNGYLFIVKNGNSEIYNTNGQYIKSLSRSVNDIVHIDDGAENLFAGFSGDELIFFNETGDYVNSKLVGAAIIDIYYSTANSALYALTGTDIIDCTNDIRYSLGTAVSSSTSFVAGNVEGTFYMLSDGAVIKYIADESLTTVCTGQDLISISYNETGDKLALVRKSDKIKVELYNDEWELVNTINNYNIAFNNVTDLFYDNYDSIYILDSGNGRIFKTDVSCKKISDIYENFLDGESKLKINGAQGMWIDNDCIIVADTEHERVIVSDYYGNVKKVIVKPEKLESLSSPFRASKVITDRNGRYYIICESVNIGAFVFSKDFEFQNFFGSNSVTTTAEAIYNYVVKLFLNKDQKSMMMSNTPNTLSNFDIDKDGFIYAVTKTDQKTVNSKFSGMIRKINYIGSDILGNGENELVFGDPEWDREKAVTNTSFVDIDVASDGWINALDAARGKVFQYSPDGQLITVFGGKGTQLGDGNTPSAVETVGDNIYVADSYTKCISIFKPTDYTVALHEAFKSMDSSELKTSIEKWQNVLSLNSNNSYAYYGLGVAYENAGEYKLAMENYKAANAKAQYSKAYKEYRKDFVNRNSLWLVLVIVALITAVILGTKKLAKRFVVPENETYAPIESKSGMPLYVLFHPADGFSQFRNRNINSTVISIGIVIVFFFIRILEFFATGFIFNSNRPVNYNLFATLFGTVIIYVLFTVSNLAVASLCDGKGNFKQIVAMTSYSMIPYLFVLLLNVGLSNILALDEEMFMSIMLVVGAVWSVILIIVGSVQIHEYTFGKTILTLFLTIVAMLIFAVLVLLLFTLVQELVSFFKTAIYELSLR